MDNRFPIIDEIHEWYMANKPKLVEQYEGKYLVIDQAHNVVSFDGHGDAYSYGVDRIGLGKFIIKQCLVVEPVAHFYTPFIIK